MLLFPKPPVAKLKAPDEAGVEAAAAAIEVGTANRLPTVLAAGMPPITVDDVAPKGLLAGAPGAPPNGLLVAAAAEGAAAAKPAKLNAPPDAGGWKGAGAAGADVAGSPNGPPKTDGLLLAAAAAGAELVAGPPSPKVPIPLPTAAFAVLLSGPSSKLMVLKADVAPAAVGLLLAPAAAVAGAAAAGADPAGMDPNKPPPGVDTAAAVVLLAAAKTLALLEAPNALLLALLPVPPKRLGLLLLLPKLRPVEAAAKPNGPEVAGAELLTPKAAEEGPRPKEVKAA